MQEPQKTAAIVHRVPVGSWSLAVSEFPAHGRPRGVVVAGHAMMCNRRTLDRPSGRGLASTLARAGLHVYTFDVRGHGDSSPESAAAAGGRWSYDDVLGGDIPAVVSFAHQRHPELRLGLLGHSLIGHAGLLWVGVTPEAPVDALALYATNLWLPSCEPRRGRWLRKRATLAAWKIVSSVAGYFPSRRLRLGTDDEPLPLVSDFWRWSATDQCRRQSDGLDYLAGRAAVKQPVLALVGERDELLCVPECCERFLQPVPNHTIRRVAGADHMSLVTKEDIGRAAWEQTAAWLIEKLDRPTDG
jgi:predicted alpha/beta hydrolase